MNFAKRAWRYVTRKKGKSFLLMLTFFLIGNLVILGLGVSQAASNAKILTRKSMRAVVSYEMDTDAYYKYANSLTDSDEANKAYANTPTIDYETAMKLAKDSRVKAYNYNVVNQVYSSGFDNVPVGNESTDSGDSSSSTMKYQLANLQISAGGGLNPIELAEGTFSIVSGNFYTQNNIDNSDNVCLITKELADLNNFNVGDDITIQLGPDDQIKQLDTNGQDSSIMKRTLTICGIYTTTQDVDPNSEMYKWMTPAQSPKNVVLMPISSYNAWISEEVPLMNQYYQQQYGGEYTPADTDAQIRLATTPSKCVYLLNDPLDVDQFVSDYTPSMGNYLWLNADNATFKKLARPLDTLNFFANIIVWIVVVNAVIIITLVTALSMKTREYEIGVLLSLGASKMKIVLQMFLELMMIALLGFTLAVGSGSLIAGKVGELVLSYQTTSDAQYGDNNSNTNYYFSESDNYFTQISQDDLLSQYHVSVSPALILEIYLLGTAVVLIAIVIPSFMIMRLNPKQILLEQN